MSSSPMLARILWVWQMRNAYWISASATFKGSRMNREKAGAPLDAMRKKNYPRPEEATNRTWMVLWYIMLQMRNASAVLKFGLRMSLHNSIPAWERYFIVRICMIPLRFLITQFEWSALSCIKQIWAVEPSSTVIIFVAQLACSE